MIRRKHAKAKNEFFRRQGSVEPEKLLSVLSTIFCHRFSNKTLRGKIFMIKKNPLGKYYKRGVDLEKVIKRGLN